MGFKVRALTLPKPRTEQDLLIVHDSPAKRFSWIELRDATNNFSSKNVVGRGGFGKVYKGQLPDGSTVAIKRSKDRSQDRDLQFQAEVQVGGNQVLSRHANVLPLLGYAMTRTDRLLVYPFLVNGSVDSLLRDRPALDWTARKRVALGVANGLNHLHSASYFAVIHRDVKAANVLLDDDFEAVLCDFGLAKVVVGSSNANATTSASGWLRRTVEEEEEELDSVDEEADRNPHCFDFTTIVNGGDDEERQACTWSCWLFTAKIDERIAQTGHQQSGTELQNNSIEVVTTVRGTKGHIAPEYHATSKCSIKNDVFAFGIMLLELITGQRAFDKARHGNGMLLDWVNALLGEDKLDLVFDSKIKGNDIQEMEQMLELALLCSATSPENRPEMSKIAEMLENIGNPIPFHHNNLGDVSVQAISLHRLKRATDNFSDKNMIGRSGFSDLYRGRLREDGSVVLVKRLVSTGKLYKMQLEREVKLGNMSGHTNVLRLIGYCFSWSESLLVYPFADRRSLDWHLGSEGHLPLNLQTRMRIALDVAKGLSYLHNDCSTVHGNVKLSNILLDDVCTPVLCNFKIPVKFEDWNQEIGIQTFHEDVYWYGVTLLCLISNNKASIRNNYDDLSLHNWLKDRLRDRQLNSLVDSRIITHDDPNRLVDIIDKIEQLFQVALLCTHPSPTSQPRIREIIQMLRGIMEGDLKVCFEYDRANLFRFLESPTYSSKALQSKGITISDNIVDQKISDRWKTFLSEVVSDGLPTEYKLFRTGMSVDPLCPLCEEYEEDNFHLFFECDISKQVWWIAVGVRIDMMGFGCVKEAVDAILKPDGASVEEIHFSQKGVYVMYSIWNHRNKVCFENVPPNVRDIVSSSQNHATKHLVPSHDDVFVGKGKGKEKQHEMAQEMYEYDDDSDCDLTSEVLSGPR